MELKKQFIITHKNGVIQNIDLDNQARCFPGSGFIGAEFDSQEELDTYIESNNLITREEAISALVAFINDEEVDIEQHMFDDNVTLVLRDVEDDLQRNIE